MTEAAKEDWQEHRQLLSDRQVALCEFAEKLASRPASMGPDDLDRLRTQGLDDGEILELVHVIGYFSHINRISHALGADLEKWMPDPPGGV